MEKPSAAQIKDLLDHDRDPTVFVAPNHNTADGFISKKDSSALRRSYVYAIATFVLGRQDVKFNANTNTNTNETMFKLFKIVC